MWSFLYSSSKYLLEIHCVPGIFNFFSNPEVAGIFLCISPEYFDCGWQKLRLAKKKKKEKILYLSYIIGQAQVWIQELNRVRLPTSYLDVYVWPQVPPWNHRPRVAFLQHGLSTEVREMRDSWPSLLTCPRGGTELLVDNPSRTMWKVGRGISSKEMGLLPKEERKLLGRQNPNFFYILFFSWKNWNLTITRTSPLPPKPCVYYMMSPDLFYPKPVSTVPGYQQEVLPGFIDEKNEIQRKWFSHLLIMWL